MYNTIELAREDFNTLVVNGKFGNLEVIDRDIDFEDVVDYDGSYTNFKVIFIDTIDKIVYSCECTLCKYTTDYEDESGYFFKAGGNEDDSESVIVSNLNEKWTKYYTKLYELNKEFNM